MSIAEPFARSTTTQMLNLKFWNGRKVFVTGHTGFKGSWLALWLDSLGADTTGYALDPPTQPNLYEQANVGSVVRSIHGDVRDLERLRTALAEARPDVVIHMAAQSVVRRGYDDPTETYASNVMGTVNLLEALRELRLACVVVNVTSDKCYANREWVWGYREIEPMGGKDPYSSSKACAELVTSAYRESYFPPAEIARHGVALGSARAGNAIGGGDWTSNQLIPDLMRAFLAGESCLIRSPSAHRPWQFLLEPLRGYLMLAERLSQDCRGFAGAWNFGPTDTDARSVAWVADELARRWGGIAAWTEDPDLHPPEAHALKLDASKSRLLLNWQPVLSLSDALMWVVEWYRGFQSGLNLQLQTRSQIDRYAGLLTQSPSTGGARGTAT